MTRKKINLETKYPLDHHTMGFVRNLAENLGPDKAEGALKEFLEVHDRSIDLYYAMLKLIKVGPSRAAHAAQLVDDAIGSFMKGFSKRSDVRCPCREGCSHCCHTRVETCGSEIDLLTERILRDNIDIDWDRLSRQAGKPADDYYESVMGSSNRCVFLDDAGRCKVYDIRPLVCREHFSAGDPDRCSMKGEIRNSHYIYIHSPRVIANALMFLEMETVGDMATNLLKRKPQICQST